MHPMSTLLVSLFESVEQKFRNYNLGSMAELKELTSIVTEPEWISRFLREVALAQTNIKTVSMMFLFQSYITYFYFDTVQHPNKPPLKSVFDALEEHHRLNPDMWDGAAKSLGMLVL